jgi:hypothetical protein
LPDALLALRRAFDHLGACDDLALLADRALAALAHGFGIRHALLAMLDAARALANTQYPEPPPWQAEADRLRGDVQRLRADLGPAWVEQVPGLADYLNLLALYQYRRFGRELARLQLEVPALQQVYQHVAGVEADLAVHQHLLQTAMTCVAEPAGARELDLQGMVHPLVQPAHALSLQLQGQGALITGQNGAGKSTLLRTVPNVRFAVTKRRPPPWWPACRWKTACAPPPACTWPNWRARGCCHRPHSRPRRCWC